MENNLRVMERLKGLRNELGFSAADMASAVNLSEKEFLAVESGEADASFTFLYKCADKLGVDLASIVTGDEPRLSEYTLSRKEDGMPIKRRECFDYSHLAYLFKDRLAEPFVVTAKYSQETENSPIALANHNGQELNYVLEGELKVHIDGHEELLHPGDSVYYQGKQLHGMVAAGGRDCKFLAVVIKGAADEDIEPIEAPASQKAGVGADDGRFYKKFTKETFDKNGMLTDIGFDFADNFNFSYDVVDELAKKNPEKLAMMWVSHGEDRRFTFGDMAKYSSKAANYFKSLGIKKGDKVMLVLRRHYQFWYAVLGLHKIGAVGIPATDQLMAKDFVYRFKTAHIRAIVCTGYGEVAKMAEDAMADSPTVEIKMMANGVRDGWDNFDGGVEKASDVFERVETNVKDPMLMYFTSGTTGYPKITVMDYSYALAHIMTARWWQNVKEDGLHFTVADTGWAKAMWGKLYGQWLCEAAVFTYDYEKMIPADLLPMFKKYGITTFCAPPTIYRFFIKEDLTKFDLSSLKYAVIAGEALNPEVYQQFYAATGLKLMEGYGQTEMVIAVANIPGMEPKPGSMGKPVPGYTFHLLGPDGNQVKTGETGEMCVYTKETTPAGMFSGYYENDEKTNEVWHDGYYHTGDMAYADEDGYFWYVGRTDDLIKSSGYRIGPFEIESVLMEMPCVMECAVTGVPDEVRGQLVKATIVLANGFEASDGLKKEIQTYVKEHTAPYKYPRVVEFVTALPKTISGKIRRVEIRGQDNK